MTRPAAPPPSDIGVLKEALALYQSGDLAAAEQNLRAIIARGGDGPEVWNLLGVVLRTTNRARESLSCYRRALAAHPAHPAAWTNLGNAFKDLGAAESAIVCHLRAIEAQPDRPELFHNLSIAYTAANRHDEAAAAASRALLINPGLKDVRWDRALALLSAGRYAEGWLDYDARIGGPGLPSRPLPGRTWRGEIDSKATLFVASEQGLGDAIWCWRYLTAARARVGRLVLECRAELAELARAQGFADAVIVHGEPTPQAEFHIFQCSLPGLFTPDVKLIPPSPYLRVPDKDYTALVPPPDGNFRVGIAWSGSPTFKANAERSAPLGRFIDNFAMPGVSLYSLQLGKAREELSALPEANVTDLAPRLKSLADTAAVVAVLDLVIMTDSSMAHLCGALGRPVWVLLPYNAYWMWGDNTEATPWYASVRLFRQRVRGDLTGVFDAAGAALLQVITTHG